MSWVSPILWAVRGVAAMAAGGGARGGAGASQGVVGADAAGCDGPGAVGDLVVDIGGGHHRLLAFDAGLVLDPAEDSPLASVPLAVDSGVHSKASWRRMVEGCEVPRLFAETRGFSSFPASISLKLRLDKD